MDQNKIKTGTTCIGIKFKDGIVIGADRRVSSFKIDSDNFTKVFQLSKYICATVSGGAADAQRLMRIVKSELKLIELKEEKLPSVKQAAMILNSLQYAGIRSSGSIVGIILAGFDVKENFQLYNLSPDGTIIPNDGYVTTGSGSIFIKGILDVEYKSTMSKKEAVELAEKCFLAAFKNDSASGGGFTIKVITKDGVEDASKKSVKLDVK
jgi:20S proteasome alpha/beta subunit